ncbi:MAG TPA: DUF2142 domain-containing protein [Acidimicrobiia bacterium]
MRWIASFALFLAVGAAWALASPINSGPDEPSHVVHAAAVARGDLIGKSDPGTPFVEVTAPRVYDPKTPCYAFHPDVPASCYELSKRTGDGTLRSYTARYLPPYGALLGFGTYWYPPGAGQIYLMRLLSAVVIAALLASCITTVAAVGSIGFSLGFLFSLTPMALYFSGVVNPSGPEIGAGIAMWVHGIALTHAGAGDDPRLVRRFGIAACVLCATRPLSPLWLLLALVVLTVVAGWPRVRTLLRRRVVQAWAAAVVVVALAQTVWSAWAKPLSEGNTAQKGLDAPLTFIVRQSVGKLYLSNTREMIGVFGWLDTLVPSATVVIWLLAIGALVVLGVSAGSRRIAWALALTIALAFLVPVTIESARASANNLVWHGRYTLPFAVGIPLLGGYALRELEATRLAIRRVAWWLGAGFVVAQGLAFAEALRRYAVGVNGRVFFFWGSTAWSPPVPSWLLLAGYLAVIAGLTWWVVGAARRGEAEPPPARAPELVDVTSA